MEQSNDGREIKRTSESKGKNKSRNRNEQPRIIRIGGIKEEIVYDSAMPSYIHSGDYVGRDSFLMKDGRYAYRDVNCDNPNKPVFYHVLTAEDENNIRFFIGLYAMDRSERESNKQYRRMQSYSFLNYQKASEGEDGDEDGRFNPMDVESFKEFQRRESREMSRPFPLKSEYAVISAAMEEMTRAGRMVFDEYMNSSSSQAEVKKSLGIKHSAWSNDKKRLYERMRGVFEYLGYDIKRLETALDEMENESVTKIDNAAREKTYEKKLDDAYQHEEDEIEEYAIGKDIAREQRMEYGKHK